MPLYEYKGVDPKGKASKGTIEADSSKTARLRLKQRGIYTTDLKEKSSKGGQPKSVLEVATGGVSLRTTTIMTRQLATMVKARIPLDDALSAVLDQTDDPKLKSIMSQVKESVNEGKSLADSCRKFPRVFSPIFVSMIAVGEASGTLDLVLTRLAGFADAQMEMRSKIIGAMAYPIIVMTIGTGITIFLFAFAVPKITEVFQGSNMAMPPLTVFMIGISHFIANYWILIVTMLGSGFFFFKWYTSTKQGRDWWDTVSLKIPFYGKFVRMVAVSRFARTLSTLIGSGVQLLEAIDIVKEVVDNAVIRKALIQSRESISEGHSIAAPLKASGQFPAMLTHMIAVGEKTGELEEMLNVVSDAYDGQVDTTLKSMTSVLGPLMIAVMGFIIGLVALSVFMPLIELNNLATTG